MPRSPAGLMAVSAIASVALLAGPTVSVGYAQRQAPPPIGATPRPAPTPPAVQAEAPRADDAESGIVARVNAMRAEAGLTPLSAHEGLAAAARQHSAEMARTGRLTHVSEETGSPADRVRAAGVQPLRVTQNVSRRRTAEAAHDAILASAPHRQQLLDPTITHIGVGIAVGEAGVFVTEVMARIAPEPELPPPAVEDVAPPAPEQPAPEAQPAPPAPPAPAPVAPAPPASQPQPPARVNPSPRAQSVPAPRAQAGAQGQIPTMRLSRIQRGVAGYWLFHGGRWWYFPVPRGARPGQLLRPDLRINGAPPGYQQRQAPTRVQPRTQVPATTAPRGYWRLTPR